MKRLSAYRPSAAMVVACLALVMAMGGSAYAAFGVPRNSVGTPQLRGGAVTAAKVRRHTLLSADFRRGQLPRGRRGATGRQGPAGTAAAYGYVASSGTLVASLSKNVVSVSEPNPGIYCVAVRGASSTSRPPVATLNYYDDDTQGGKLAHVEWDSATLTECSAASDYLFRTFQIRATSGSLSVNASPEGFSFVIP